MSRIVNIMDLSETFTFGKFMGLTVKEAIERNAKEMLRMNNNGHFALDIEALEYLKKNLI